MIVYSVEFPTSVGTSLDDVAGIAVKWLTGSPHYGWNAADLSDVPNGEVKEFRRDGQEVIWAQYNTPTDRTVGFKHTWTEANRIEWVTEIVGNIAGEQVWVAARLHANAPPGTKIPKPRQPYIVKQLIRDLGGGDDAGLTVSDLPHSLGLGDLEMAAAMINGTVAIGLPIVYVSVGNNGECYVECKELAKRLCALAHVVIEPDRKFSFDLRDIVDGENPYAGAIGIFWPQGGGAPVRLMPNYRSEQDLLGHIVDVVESAIRASRPRPGLTWSAIESTIARINAENLRASGEQNIGKYVETFDAEIASQKTLLNEANAEVERLKAEVRRLQSSKDAAAGTLRRGNEVDLFPGELRMIVVEALKEARARSSEKSRSYDVLNELIELNAVTDKRIEYREIVKRVLSTARKLSDAERKDLEDIGFKITDQGKHYKAVFADDERYTFALTKTAGDHRSGKNSASQINRMMFS